MQAIQTAIDHLGSQSALAKAIGVAPQVVHNWVVRGNVPAEWCPEIEKATGGAVRCEDLRADVDWAYLRGTTPAETEVKPAVECGAIDPRHGDRRSPDQRQCADRRKGDA